MKCEQKQGGQGVTRREFEGYHDGPLKGSLKTVRLLLISDAV